MTEEAIDCILRCVAAGLHPDRAAAAAGVSSSTMRNHKRRHPGFATQLKKAQADAEASFLSRIVRHSDERWQAAAWILERRWPERWRQQTGNDLKVKVRNETPGPAAPAGEELTTYFEQLAAMPDILRDRQGPTRN